MPGARRWLCAKYYSNALCCVVLFLSLCQNMARAQPSSAPDDTRAKIWSRQREEKLLKLQPYRSGGLERALWWVEKNGFQIFTVNYKGFYPRIGNLSTGSGFAPAVRFWSPDTGGSPFDIQSSAAYSTRGYQQYDLQFGKYDEKAPEYFLSANRTGIRPVGDILVRERRSFLYADLRYQYFPQEDFFGLGPDSQESERTDYLQESATYSVVAGYQFARWFGAGLRAGLLQVNIGPGTDSRFPTTQEVFTPAEAPGLYDQPLFYHLTSSAIFDLRDKPKNPHSGGMLGLSFTWVDDSRTDLFRFRRFALDGRYYLPLGSVARVLALRAFASTDSADNGQVVPFYLMDTLGGSQTLRGFREFRFRDTNLMYLSAEYRWEAVPAIEGVLFYDTGKVFSDRSDFNFDNLEDSWGAGIRLKTSNAVIVRFDVGFSREGTRYFLKFAPSF